MIFFIVFKFLATVVFTAFITFTATVFIIKFIISYTHRIGRTGRAGKKGIAVTFVNPIEMDYIRQIEQTNDRRMRALRPPHRKEVLRARENDIKEKVEKWMSQEHSERLQDISSQLLNEYNDDTSSTSLYSFNN